MYELKKNTKISWRELGRQFEMDHKKAKRFYESYKKRLEEENKPEGLEPIENEPIQ